VFGAVSGVAGSVAAVEAIKLITGIGESLAGRMLAGDLGNGRMRTVNTTAAGCAVCQPAKHHGR
jgi:molybdopterin/thiamine biosynthesis adenylyltransferase